MDYNKTFEKFKKVLGSEAFYKSVNGRKIIIWGACEAGDIAADVLMEVFGERYTDIVCGFVDNNLKSHGTVRKKVQVFPTKHIKNRNDEFYVVVPIRYYEEVVTELDDLKYQRDFDYVYFVYRKFSTVIVQSNGGYEDTRGNSIIGEFCGKIIFNGFGAKVCVGQNVHIGENTEFVLNDDAELVIEEGVHIGDDCQFICESGSLIKIGRCSVLSKEAYAFVQANAKLIFGEKDEIGSRSHFTCTNDSYTEIGNYVKFLKSGLNVTNLGEIVIGNGNIFMNDFNIQAVKNSSIKIGSDCIISWNVKILSGNSHSIFDLKNKKKYINENRKQVIEIGNHVWLGMDVSILSGTELKKGSIVGAGSVVTGRKFPSNCIVAGNPAKIIKKDVDWDINDTMTFEEFEKINNL